MTDDILVSIAIASYNCERFLAASVRSALAQTVGPLEVIVVDDCSTDGSVAVAEALAAADSRVRVARLERNSGPGGARNRALAMARGRWFAVLDSDDLYHPDRLARLIAHAEAEGLDIVADDLLLFQDDESAPPHRFLKVRSSAPYRVPVDRYLAETVMFGRLPNLGFLKPVIRRAALVAHDLCYDERLRIAEDDDLVIRMLAAGMTYGIAPSLTYFYRKHGASISHRMAEHHLDAMIVAGERQAALLGNDRNARAGLARRARAFRHACAFTRFIDALKARRLAAAARIAVATPGMLPLLRMPVAGALAKLRARRIEPTTMVRDGRRHVTIVSRQRLVGPTNGSSAYLLDLVEAVRGAGLVPHLVQPAPSLLGRIPVLKLHPSMAAFETHRIRGVVRIGNRVFARDPHVWAGALRGVASRIGRRLGLRWHWLADRPAPYAIAVPWTDEDRLFVADALRGRHDVVLADYVFQAEAFPYALGEARTGIVMHDLFHARGDALKDGQATDSVAQLDRETEIDLLGRADAVIAIQAAEASFVERNVPGTCVILAPMGARPVAAAQPGAGATLVFVGSNTAPNVVGLRWFVDEVWPLVRRAVPAAELRVAGTVARAFVEDVPGVTFLGIVDDLAPVIARAAVLISPLTFGSGLKIKLIEAMAAGKAIVATTVTMQGVEDIDVDAVCVTDGADMFAAHIVRLLGDEALRRAMGERALAVARARFSPSAAHVALVEWLA